MKLKKEAGYLNIDLGGVMIGLLIMGTVAGLVLSVAVPWVWACIKPWLHALSS